MSGFMRITRTTLPHGPDKLVFSHPYAIWLNDTGAKVYNGSLIIPINQEAIEYILSKIKKKQKFSSSVFRIDKLILSRSKQGVLSKIQQFQIFSSNQIDFTSKLIFNSFNYSIII